MMLLFCADPIDPRQPDPSFVAEFAAAAGLGLECGLVSYELLVEGDAGAAVRRVKARARETFAVYRGLTLTPQQYRALYGALEARGVRLLNDPGAYRFCQHLPECYRAIRELSPRTVWLKETGEVSIDAVMEAIEPFGQAPIVVRDYVCCQKGAWEEAGFVPSAGDRGVVERVVRRFLTLQGQLLQGGLVFREFVPLEPLDGQSRPGIPWSREFRIFFLEEQPVHVQDYWEEGDYGTLAPPIELFRPVAAQVRSRFFTMDVAQRRDGTWIILELGDGQVARLPASTHFQTLYTRLMELAVGRHAETRRTGR